MNEMQESQPSLHNKNPQKQQLTASKTIEIKNCKGVDGVLKFTSNPYKRFRSKKIEACGTRRVKTLPCQMLNCVCFMFTSGKVFIDCSKGTDVDEEPLFVAIQLLRRIYDWW